MTREELKEHCERQVQQFERVKKIMPITPNDWKRYEEHKLVLELLERENVLDKIRAEIEQRKKNSCGDPSRDLAFNVCLQIIDKYKLESEGTE